MNPMLFFAVLVLAMLIGMGALMAYAMSGRHRRSEAKSSLESEKGKEARKHEES